MSEPERALWYAMTYPVIKFASPQEALATEFSFKQQGVPCLIVPPPRALSEGCGLALRIFPQDVGRSLAIIDIAQYQATCYHWDDALATWQEASFSS